MRQDHQQQVGIVQRQVLTQSARQLVQLVVAPPAEFADLVARGAADNPFLSVSRSVLRGAEVRPDIPAQRPGLYAHVLAELPLLLRHKADLPIALRLAEGLDERGFLADPLPGIAAELKLPQDRVAAVLRQLQEIEPTGLFARTVGECLALHLRAQGQLDDVAVRVLGNLGGLSASGPGEFARRHGLDPARTAQVVDLVARLPRTAAAAFAEAPPAALPELIFERQDGQWTVRSALQCAPQLTLREATYRRALEVAADASARTETRRKWREACALHQAATLRDSTLAEMGRHLLAAQGAGLDSGLARLAPLTQREMAAQLSVHPSTVSRMVRHRFAQLDGRIVPLSRFFERPLAAGTAPTRSVVLCALRDLLASDPVAAGLSDLALARRLALAGIDVPRRRLAKYREMLGIPSSRRRRAAVPT
jgi:RNA polymerase sigma-54 factor